MTASILTFVFIGLSVLEMIAIGFNLLGIQDYFVNIFSLYGVQNGEIEEMIVYMYFSLSLDILFNVYFARYYLRMYRYGVGQKQAESLVRHGAIQMILVSLVPGMLGLIAGIVMNSQKGSAHKKVVPQNVGVSELKLEAMKEAVARLKELRAQGAISEEEYYATLNKIIEG